MTPYSVKTAIRHLGLRAGRFAKRMMQSSFRAIAPVLVAVAFTACDSLLDVDIPGRLPAESIADPSMVDILVNSVQADFECGYANYAAFTGLYTDEWMSSSSFGPGPEAIDKRDAVIQDMGATTCTGSLNPSTTGYYAPLQIARSQGETAFEIISGQSNVTNKDQKLATIATYIGYSLTLLGEGFCAMAVDEGPLMQPSDILALAETRFTTALDLAQPAGATAIVNWASVGRARVRLDLGNTAGALSDASAVPAGFVKNATHDPSPGRRANPQYSANVNGRFWTLDVSFQNLMVSGVDPATETTPMTAVDTRLVGIDQGRAGHDGQSPLWTTNKFTASNSPTPLATWQEAQLIIAEIQGGQTAVNAINAIRDAAPGGPLPHFVSTDPAAIRAEVLEERRRVLFGQGQRIADVVRLPSEVTLPTGARPYKPSQEYNSGLMGCLPLPWAEYDGNPNL